jgi:hypothetical protein
MNENPTEKSRQNVLNARINQGGIVAHEFGVHKLGDHKKNKHTRTHTK